MALEKGRIRTGEIMSHRHGTAQSVGLVDDKRQPPPVAKQMEDRQGFYQEKW